MELPNFLRAPLARERDRIRNEIIVGTHQVVDELLDRDSIGKFIIGVKDVELVRPILDWSTLRGYGENRGRS